MQVMILLFRLMISSYTSPSLAVVVLKAYEFLDGKRNQLWLNASNTEWSGVLVPQALLISHLSL